MLTKDRIVEDLLGIKNIVTKERRVLASGKLARYYIDIKRSYGESGIIWQYVDYIINVFGSEMEEFSCVIGSGHGGIPLATAVSLHPKLKNIKLVLVRNKLKNHGLPTLFDGKPLEELDQNKKVLIVDDVFTTGGSIKKDIISVLPKDLKFEIFVVCNRSGFEAPEINGVKVNYILTPDDLMSQ